MTEDSREQMVQFLMWIWKTDRAFIDMDASDRYPELMIKGPHGRGRSPAIRDMIAFVRSNYPFFRRWIATRDQNAS